MLKDHGSRDRVVNVAYQVFEQQKFSRTQIDRLYQAGSACCQPLTDFGQPQTVSVSPLYRSDC
jgi:hypothetical protein